MELYFYTCTYLQGIVLNLAEGDLYLYLESQLLMIYFKISSYFKLHF